jgi:hypothetical protein
VAGIAVGAVAVKAVAWLSTYRKRAIVGT